MVPQEVPNIQGLTPKMFVGHNLHLVAPFELIPAVFCTILWRASFWFSGLGAKSGPRWATFWAGDLLGTQKVSKKDGMKEN